MEGASICVCIYIYIYVYLSSLPQRSRAEKRSILEIFLKNKLSMRLGSLKKWWEKRITFAKDRHPVIQEFKNMSTLITGFDKATGFTIIT